MRPVVSQVGPGDLSEMIQMASCQGQGFLVTLVTAFTGAAALGEEGMPVLGEELWKVLVKRVLESFQNDPVCFRLQEVLLSIHFQQLYLL